MDEMPPRRAWLSFVIGLLAVWGSLIIAGDVAGLVARSRWTPYWSAVLFVAVLLAYSLGTRAGRRTPARYYVIGALMMLPLHVALLILVASRQWLWLALLSAAPLNVGYYERTGPDGFPFGYLFAWPLIVLAIVGLTLFLREALLLRFEDRFSPPPGQ